jgi:hypothetical protein
MLKKESMINNIIDLLALDEYYGVSERVDIAKGKYETPNTFRSFWKMIKRYYYGKKG